MERASRNMSASSDVNGVGTLSLCLHFTGQSKIITNAKITALGGETQHQRQRNWGMCALLITGVRNGQNVPDRDDSKM
jgi:hypothetical protein